jgi:hypothetical protein
MLRKSIVEYDTWVELCEDLAQQRSAVDSLIRFPESYLSDSFAFQEQNRFMMRSEVMSKHKSCPVSWGGGGRGVCGFSGREVTTVVFFV